MDIKTEEIEAEINKLNLDDERKRIFNELLNSIDTILRKVVKL